MNFLYPAFLFGAAAIAIPIVLHLLRRDVAPEVPFSAVRLLKKSPVERSRRRRLRDLLLLAARVTALLLLAAAFARPFAPGAASAMQPLRIVAIDRSFSMGAPGTFERALALAGTAIDEAAFGERLAVIAFDDRAEIVAPPGGPAEARAAIAALRPGSGATRYPAALSTASELATGGAVRVIVVTDLQRAGWEGESRARVPASMQVEVRDAGAPRANVALTGARVDSQRLSASIRNASPVARTGAVVVTHEGREAARARYSAAAGATVDVSVPWNASTGGVVLSIADDEGYPADNARHLVVSSAATPAVMIITSPDSPGLYLERALDAAQAGALTPLQPRLVAPAEIAGGRAESIARHRAVILLSTRSLDRAARDGIAAFVRSGGGLMIAASPDVEASVVTAMFGWPASSFAPADSREGSLTATDVRHPIFRPFGAFAANLGNVRFSRAWRIRGDGWHVPARFDDGTPALLERSEGAGRVVIFASDLDRRWNDFPLHPSFVPFVTEAIRHVASKNAEPTELVVGRVPASVKPVPGLHRLESGRTVAVNVDPRESGIGVMTAQEFAGMLEPVQPAQEDRPAREEQTESRQNLWQYGLILMLAALIAESFVGRA
ncbi:MAG TPA: BatA and WFA domain-containing protein [Vicinamibacterales bacterium]|nr:BatA and WFA domain-containing protein [Vicinamibacterales bacterium]